MEEAVRGRRRREKGEASEEAEVGAADRIDRADAGGVAKDRLKDETQSETRGWQTFWLGRSQRRGEVVGAKLQEVGNKEEPASAGRGQPTFEQGGHVSLDGVAGDDAGARLAGTVEDFDLLLGQESRREWRGCPPFFFARP